MSLSVTVTGATGFLGNNLVRLLVAEGHQVTVIVRPGSEQKPFEGVEVTIVEGLLDDLELLDETLCKADVVVHAAAFIWFGKAHLEKSRQVNVELTRSIAQIARRHEIRMIHVSTVDTLAAAPNCNDFMNETNLNPIKANTAYSISKREAEQMFLEQVEMGLDGVIVNPGYMVGPWDWKPSSGKMIQAIAKSWVPMAPGGGFSIVNVRDVCRGIILAIEKGRCGERYILAGHNMTYLDLWKVFAAKSGRSWPRYKMRPLMAFVVGKLGDLSHLITRNESEINSVAVSSAQKFSYYSSAKAEQELGYVIGPIDSAIDEAFNWLNERGYL